MTTVPKSTAAPVKAWLYAQLSARPEFGRGSGVGVYYGTPGTDLPDDVVAIGPVHRTVRRHAFVGDMGTGSLIEDYTLSVTASSFRGGDDPQGTYEAVAALADTIVDTVRQDPTAGGLLLEMWPSQIEDNNGDDEAGHKGRLNDIAITIQCQAII